MYDIGATAPLSELDEQTRAKLASLLAKRNEYYRMKLKLNDMKLLVLKNPNAAAEQAIGEYATLVIAPLRKSLGDEMLSILKDSVNVEQLKEMLPMILAAVIGSVNIPLFFNALGVDVDMIADLVETIRTYIRDGVN